MTVDPAHRLTVVKSASQRYALHVGMEWCSIGIASAGRRCISARHGRVLTMPNATGFARFHVPLTPLEGFPCSWHGVCDGGSADMMNSRSTSSGVNHEKIQFNECSSQRSTSDGTARAPNSGVRVGGSHAHRPCRKHAPSKYDRPEPIARRHHYASGLVQEAPLAGVRTNFLSFFLFCFDKLCNVQTEFPELDPQSLAGNSKQLSRLMLVSPSIFQNARQQ